MQQPAFLRETEYSLQMQQTVQPVLQSAREERTLTTADGKQLFVVCYRARQPRGSVVILHGFGETAEKYHELCYYFLQCGYNVLVYDQRGHGRSTRLAAQGVVHNPEFEKYVEDLAFVLEAEQESLPAPRYLFSHSMGGAVAALYLERGGSFFKKAVLSSPMIYMHHKRVPRKAGELLCHIGCRLRPAADRFFAVSAAPTPENESFERSAASSQARFEYYRTVKSQSPLLYASKASNGWMLEAMRCPRRILKKGAPERVQTPLRVYAAEWETLVDRRPQQKFAKRVQTGRFFLVKGCKHEIYFATDEVLHPFLCELLAYFDVTPPNG